MKSADVSDKAIPVQICHPQADAGGAAGQAAARAGAVVRARTAAAAALQRAAPKSVDRPGREAVQGRRASLLRPEPVRTFAIEVPARHALTVGGYAAAPRAAATSAGAAGPSGASRSTSGSSQGEWDFLDRSTLSIEDKLFTFMKLVMKKSDDELVQKMKEYKATKAKGSSSASGTGSSGGLFGLLKKVLPPLAALEKVVPALPQLVNKLATDLGPQVLGALMIPLGAPWAAPLVQRAASQLLPAALAAADGGSGGAASTSSGSSGASGTSEGDERMQLLEIERMMQKTNQMFATVSNILKATHDAAMTAVNNIR